MIITLRNADFSLSNIGTLNTWSIIRSLGTGASYSGPTYVNKNATFKAIVTLDEGYEIGSAGITITMGNIQQDSSVYSIVDNVITISITAVNGNISIVVPTVNSSGEEDSGNNNPDNIVTWEMGAIVSTSGSNSDDSNMKKSRIRTTGYLQVINKITISCFGNAEFCPIYFDADEIFISSPNAYQTTPLTIDSNTYPLVRIMARDKTNTSSCSLDLAKDILVSGNFIEIPYKSGNLNFEDNAVPPLSENVVWHVSAINSNNGTVTSNMKTRIITNRIPLSDSTTTITPTGDAEIYAFWYDSNGVMTSTSPVYQTAPIVTSNEDGHSICIMARNKTNVNATLTKDFGNNITITK